MKCWTLAIFLVACGGSSTKEAKKPTPPSTGPVAADAAPVGEEPATTPAGDKLSAEQCEQLFEHMFDIAITSQNASLPDEERPTAADIVKAKTAMRGQLEPECLTRTRAELKYDCYMAATDRGGFEACDKS